MLPRHLHQLHTSPHEVNQSGTPTNPEWRSTQPAPDPFHFDHDLHNSLKVHQGSLLVVVEAATTSSLQIPAERHAILTCPAESKRMQVQDGVVVEPRDLQPSDDEAIRHHDSLTNSTLKMGCLVSGQRRKSADLLDRPWKGSGGGVDAIEDRPLTESLRQPSGFQRTDGTISTLAVPAWG